MRVREPGEPGYDPVQFKGFAMRVGINLARKVGWGDGLESALATRFPTAPADMISQVRGILQQGNFAAQQLTMLALGATPNSIASADYGPDNASGATPAFNLDAIPIVPPTFAPEAAGNRIVVAGDALSTSTQGEPIDAEYMVFGGNEDMDYEDVLDEAIARLYENKAKSPDAVPGNIIDRIIRWVTRFVGRIF